MSFPNLRLSALALAASLAVVVAACGGGSDEEKDKSVQASVPDATMHFNRVSTFTICEQLGSFCESDTAVNAEIVAAKSRTNFCSPGTSSEAAWSVPFQVRSFVKWRSIQRAPSANAAMSMAIPK